MSFTFVTEPYLPSAPPGGESPSMHAITEQIGSIAERPVKSGFWLPFALAASFFCLLIAALAHLVGRGIGVWGNQQSIAWAWDIAGFVFWIGIGHAGTLISAILYLFRQHWRTSINRAAEAATIFAVMAAAIYPVFHLGRVWLGYWLIPAPNQMLVWPNFKSPLTWDVFAISTYFSVSLAFWYLGMIPDLATLRDRARTPLRRKLLSTLALGWRSSQRHWQFYERTYLILAGLGTALVVSVHTIVSLDFAVSVLPGWHNTIFPPYFVAGAVLSGSAMVATILVLVRRAYGLEASITERHLANLNKLILATSWMVAAAYLVELYLAWYSGDEFEQSVLFGRMHGPLAVTYWAMMFCNIALPQLFWLRSVRTSPVCTFIIGIGVSIGMWVERFVIVVGGLDRGFLPSTWSEFQPTIVDVATLVGTFGLFFSLFLLFLRWVPIMSMSEIKADLVGHAAASDPIEPPLTTSATDDAKSYELGTTHAKPSRPNSDSAGGRSPRLLLAGCDSIEVLRRACRSLDGTAAQSIDVHAPLLIPELGHGLNTDTSMVAWSAGVCGLLGAVVAVVMQYWTQALDYPMLLAGKPPWSWQSAVPITFELTILGAACGSIGAFLWLCRLPRLHHPLLNCERFRSASDDGLFVSIEVAREDTQDVVHTLRSVGVHRIVGVED